MFRKIKRIGLQLIDDICVAHIKRTEGYVVMLHRIGPEEPWRLPCIAELNVTVDFLQRFVDMHCKRYDFVSLDEVLARRANPTQYKRPYIAFTFDDGFRDNLTYGLPFFGRNNIPFAVFITTDFINRHPAFNYLFVLERIIANNDSLIVNGISYACKTIKQKNDTFGVLKERVLYLPYHDFEQSFNRMFAKYIKPEYYEDLTMTWDEVKQLAASPLCTIGSHTVTHPRLSNLSEAEIEFELMESKQQIETHIGKEVKYLSYPYGWKTDVNEQVVEMANRLYVADFQSFATSWGGESNRLIDRVLLNMYE